VEETCSVTIPEFLNFAGVFVFAATGALAASRRQLDIIGFLFLANITGIGGGTFRDLVLGAPVFWVVEPTYLLAGTLAAIFVYFTAHMVLMRREIYVTASLAGACLYVLLAWLQVEPAICAIAAALTAFLIRGDALYFGWTLPVYKSRPGRTEEELQRDRIIRPE